MKWIKKMLNKLFKNRTVIITGYKEPSFSEWSREYRELNNLDRHNKPKNQ